MTEKNNEELTVEEQLSLIEEQMSALEAMGDNSFIKPQCFAETGCIDSPRGQLNNEDNEKE